MMYRPFGGRRPSADIDELIHRSLRDQLTDEESDWLARWRRKPPRVCARLRNAAMPLRLLTLASLTASMPAHAQGQGVPALMEHYGCSICHANDETKAGPAWIDIAAKYRGNADAD